MRKYQGDACVAPTNVNHYLLVLVVCLVLASGSLMAQRTAESRNMVLADTTIYANDRFTGGLYILRYTGSVPMD